MTATSRPRVWTFRCAWDAVLTLAFGSAVAGTFLNIGIPSAGQLAAGGPPDILGILIALAFFVLASITAYWVGRDVEDNLRARAEWDARQGLSS